jgi:D-beta-D-heptose 7-phosphate kinase/D-beta-D-heptose 1-phosphate adenosyltransferase
VRIDGPSYRAVVHALEAADAVLVADYARGVTAHPRVREALAARAPHQPLVWDPHPRGSDPVPGTWLLTPNQHEVAGPADARSLGGIADAARGLRARAETRAVAVTLGDRGALLVTGDGAPLMCPCEAPATGDVSGAGDAFATGAAIALGRGAVHSEAVTAGVASGRAFVDSLHERTWFDESGTPIDPGGSDHRNDPAGDDRVASLVARTRAAGGTVVMTGGCFDLLHRGHVQLLRQARALGDCLVVCLNGDDSVRRLKGTRRPVVPAADRARVLRALEAVDDVVVFDEDTPVEALRRHRPDLFVKGGDYGGTEIPEAAAMAEWGGDVVIVPYVDGHSTTRLLKEALHE